MIDQFTNGTERYRPPEEPTPKDVLGVFRETEYPLVTRKARNAREATA